MWKNRHFVVALLVAPILALIAYFATDYIVAERPQAAVSGSSYPLAAKSNCRYASGECDLENGDVRLRVTVSRAAQLPGMRLHLTSALGIADARVALADSPGDDAPPLSFVADDATATSWSTDIGVPASSPESRLRLVVTVSESRYFAEVPTVFFERETAFTR